ALPAEDAAALPAQRRRRTQRALRRQRTQRRRRRQRLQLPVTIVGPASSRPLDLAGWKPAPRRWSTGEMPKEGVEPSSPQARVLARRVFAVSPLRRPDRARLFPRRAAPPPGSPARAPAAPRATPPGKRLPPARSTEPAGVRGTLRPRTPTALPA